MRRLERVCSAAAFCVPARVSRVAPDRAGHAAKSSLCSGVRSLVAMSRCVCGRGGVARRGREGGAEIQEDKGGRKVGYQAPPAHGCAAS